MKAHAPFSPLWSIPKKKPVSHGFCAHAHCSYPAFHRAPKKQGKGYLWFCKHHIVTYNENYSFLEGMSGKQITHVLWVSRLRGSVDDALLPPKVPPPIKKENMHKSAQPLEVKLWTLHRQHEALRDLHLGKQASARDVHLRYRALVMQMHPDVAPVKDGKCLAKVIKSYRYLCRFLPSLSNKSSTKEG